ncbi:MAG TPA: DNA-3-methyladenine glycosylase I [Bacteroidales bacterium]|nr:DNA-3-methyladenine glycosylase I [Bacteroidales bacterium]
MEQRCFWPQNDTLMIAYHDQEWGVPVFDDNKLFEFIVLDSFQAGLSWKTILYKRENFRKAFADFNAKKIVKFDESKIQELLQDIGIIRNELKIRATIKNAQAFLTVQKEFGNFHSYIWQFTKEKTILNNWKTHKEIPVSTLESDTMSKDLKKRGFSFVGTTICYAFMQAAGMVNDHTTDCFRHKEIVKIAKK